MAVGGASRDVGLGHSDAHIINAVLLIVSMHGVDGSAARDGNALASKAGAKAATQAAGCCCTGSAGPAAPACQNALRGEVAAGRAACSSTGTQADGRGARHAADAAAPPPAIPWHCSCPIHELLLCNEGAVLDAAGQPPCQHVPHSIPDARGEAVDNGVHPALAAAAALLQDVQGEELLAPSAGLHNPVDAGEEPDNEQNEGVVLEPTEDVSDLVGCGVIVAGCLNGGLQQLDDPVVDSSVEHQAEPHGAVELNPPPVALLLNCKRSEGGGGQGRRVIKRDELSRQMRRMLLPTTCWCG